MSDKNSDQPERILDLDAGVAMVVTDLHGDWDAYRRYRDRFLALKAQGTADYLLVLGDMIHRYGRPETDASVKIVLDLMAMQEEHGEQVICLLGNHELPHIYSILLQKGDALFTPRFEAALGSDREPILDFFHRLPFYIRTHAGVTLCHAGATAVIGERDGLKRLAHFSHRAQLQAAAESITDENRPQLMREIRKAYNKTYNEMARKFFAVSGIDDPRYDNFLVGTVATTGNDDFDLLWSALFTRNEYEYGDYGYSVILNTMLQALSVDHEPQIVLVTGHIDCRDGYKIIGNKQLRLASAQHAQPREAGRYLLFDMGEDRIETAEDLVDGLHSVFD